MAEEGKGYGPWVKHPVDWQSLRRDVAERREIDSAHCQAVERVHLDLLKQLQVPPVLFEGGTNYASAAATAATYGSCVLKSAAEIMQSLKDIGAANVVQDSRLRRGAYLVVPPDTLHRMKMGPVFAEVPEVEDGPIRFNVFMDYGVRIPIYRSMLLCDTCDTSLPRYKPRPLPDPVQNVQAWQYVVAVAAGVMILSMMFSAVGAL